MILYTSVGCDIVKISRVKKILKHKDIYEKVYHKSELEKFDAQHLAGIFAVKEASFKALELKNDQWLDIEVVSAENGKPLIKFSNNIDRKSIHSLDVSISHEDDYAIAVVSVLRNK